MQAAQLQLGFSEIEPQFHRSEGSLRTCMPARVFQHGVPPQRIRTFLILFAVALAAPLLGLAVYSLNRMASLEQAEIERRVLQVAEDLAHDIDRELDRATAILDTLATSMVLRRGDLPAFHEQAKAALKHTGAAIVLVDRTYQQLTSTMAQFGAPLPKTADPETARRVFETKERQVSGLFRGSMDGRPVFNVEVPVLAGDTVLYVLIMSFQANHISNLITRPNLGSAWINGVTDNNGIILARSERHDEFVGKPLPPELLQRSRAAKGVFRATSVAGADILRGTVRSDVAGWLVSATVPVSFLDEPRRRGELFAAIMLGTALTLGLALAYIFGGFMARPITDATAAAANVGAGKLVEPLQSPLAEANTLTAVLSDASLELKKRQEHAAFLMGELAHRAKNQLAVVRGMALQTARQSKSVDEFTDGFNQRLQGLAESQDLMVRQNWQGAWLGDLVRAHLNLFGAIQRADIFGPALFLDANAVQNLGFALHELATNAFKHGALHTPGGRVSVSWHRTDDRIHLEWKETGGPETNEPDHKGFGSLVLTQLVPQALQGNATLEFTLEGCRWTLDFPASHVLTTPPLPNQSPP
jgi:two-component sensor histidine kinase